MVESRLTRWLPHIGVPSEGDARCLQQAYPCSVKTQFLTGDAAHTSETAMDAARARRRFVRQMEQRFGPLPARDKSRVMAAPAPCSRQWKTGWWAPPQCGRCSLLEAGSALAASRRKASISASSAWNSSIFRCRNRCVMAAFAAIPLGVSTYT